MLAVSKFASLLSLPLPDTWRYKPSPSTVLNPRPALMQDYLVRHLYEPPASLVPLIWANLFSLSTHCSPPSCPLTPELETNDAPALQP